MSAAIASRLAALEAARPSASAARRVVIVVSGEGQEAEVRKLLRKHGLDPKAGDLLIIRRCIVSAPGEEPYREPPYLLGFSEDTAGIGRAETTRRSAPRRSLDLDGDGRPE